METVFTATPISTDSPLWHQVERVERAVDSLVAAARAIAEVRGTPPRPLPESLRSSSNALRPMVLLLARCCARLVGHAAEAAEQQVGRARELVGALAGRGAPRTPPGGVHQSVLAVLSYAEATRRLLSAVEAMRLCLADLDGSVSELEDLALLEQEARIGTSRTQRLAREASASLEHWRC